VLEGIRKVRNNEKIEYEYEEPNEVLSHLKVYVE
jgi:membrane fusion protein, multidrug efflux system